MALLTPNCTYNINGVLINEKIIPDGTRWTNAAKAKAAGFSANSLYKRQSKLCGTGKASSVTIHNTNDLPNVHDDGEQYTRATYNENMKSARVHFYIDDTGAWQNLKAGTGLCAHDPKGSAEVAWHAGDGSTTNGGNMTSLSLEIIMNENADHDKKAYDNGARIAAWLLWNNGLTIDKLVTHTYWINVSKGKKFDDIDKMCTNRIVGQKMCPSYIFETQIDSNKAYTNWKKFKALVKTYLDALNGNTQPVTPNVTIPTNTTTPAKKTAQQLADEIWAGKWGNGADRTSSLKAAGYTDAEIKAAQNIVNNKGKTSVTETTVKPAAPAKKTAQQLADEIWAGKWGNGADRTANLKKAGYTDAEIKAAQNIVNNKGKTNTTTTIKTEVPVKPAAPAKKTAQQLADEIWAGKWGNGSTRTTNLKNAGYTDAEIKAAQNIVNNKGKTSTVKPTKLSATALAKEIKAGKWGNGSTRTTNLKNAGYTTTEIKAAQTLINQGKV